MRDSRYFISARTYALAFAVALSPSLMQTSELTCTPPTGDTTLLVLAFELSGQDQLTFNSGQRSYDVSTNAHTAVVRVQATDPDARVSYQWSADGHFIEEGQIGVGGGQMTVDMPLGHAALRIMVVTGHSSTRGASP